jgi:hypothetical protein
MPLLASSAGEESQALGFGFFVMKEREQNVAASTRDRRRLMKQGCGKHDS